MNAPTDGPAYRYFIRCPETRAWDEVSEWDYAAMTQALKELPAFFNGVQIARTQVAAPVTHSAAE